MSTYQIKFVGPAAIAVRIATMLADADGVDLTSSKPPSVSDHDTVELAVEVEGAKADVTAALAAIRAALPVDASIDVIGH
ncbi:MAG: hypothetical protein ABIR32_16300 [Ilumatobacteraceae bacterium]